MTRTLYDSVDPQAIPKSATMVAGYVDGQWQTVPALHGRFPNATVVRITVAGGTLDAHVADVETGDLSPASGATWAKKKVAAGQHPTLYCNLSTWPAVKAAVQSAGLTGKVSYWIAHYNGDPTIPAGAVAVQYADKGPHGENIDISAVAAYWPGVDPAPDLRFPAWYRRGHPLKRGMVGWRVIGLKRRLKALGYGHIAWASPVFGSGVGRAVWDFQSHHHLPVTGVVNDVTAQALRAA